jgi:integrase
MTTADLAKMPFQKAAEGWLETRRPFLSPRTVKDYEEYIRTLTKFFSEVKLPDITPDLIRAYQRMRRATAGGHKINQECGCLAQMLKRIGRWRDISDDYQPLPVPKESPGRALSEQEYERLFRNAASKPEWEMAYLFAVISVNTSAGPKEVWTLRLQDVSLQDRYIRIQPEGAKNPHRVRVIPLNDQAFAAVERVLELAKQRGSVAPKHYIFPFRVSGNGYGGVYDPTKHCTTCKTAWKKLTIAANLAGLRPYDLRHTAITAILENPEVSEQTAEAIAGHIRPEMKKRYSHIRIAKMRLATSALGRIQAEAIVPMDEQPSLTNDNVVEMLKDLPAEIVIAKVKGSRCRFNTFPEVLKQLKASGVPDPVILAMVKAS